MDQNIFKYNEISWKLLYLWIFSTDFSLTKTISLENKTLTASWFLWPLKGNYRKPVTKTLAHELVVLLWTNVLRSWERKMLQFIKTSHKITERCSMYRKCWILNCPHSQVSRYNMGSDDDGKRIFHVEIDLRMCSI